MFYILSITLVINAILVNKKMRRGKPFPIAFCSFSLGMNFCAILIKILVDMGVPFNF